MQKIMLKGEMLLPQSKGEIERNRLSIKVKFPE